MRTRHEKHSLQTFISALGCHHDRISRFDADHFLGHCPYRPTMWVVVLFPSIFQIKDLRLASAISFCGAVSTPKWPLPCIKTQLGLCNLLGYQWFVHAGAWKELLCYKVELSADVYSSSGNFLENVTSTSSIKYYWSSSYPWSPTARTSTTFMSLFCRTFFTTIPYQRTWFVANHYGILKIGKRTKTDAAAPYAASVFIYTHILRGRSLWFWRDKYG